MTYTPQEPSIFTGPVLPSVGLSKLWGNHNEVANAYEQQLGGYFGELETTDDDVMIWSFRCRANAGQRQVRVDYRFERTSGTGTFSVTLASSADSDVVSHSVAGPLTGTVTVDVPAGGDAELTLELERTTGNGAAMLQAWQAYCLPGDFAGFVRSSETGRWEVAGEPVNIEHVDRLLNGPIQIARDGPHCLMSHCAPDISNVGGLIKGRVDFRYWGLSGSSTDGGAMTQVGYGALHIAGGRTRTLTVDSWIEATDEVDALLRIGGWTWEPGVARDRTTVTLSPGWHQVVAALKVPTDEEALWHSLQIWRR
jgi:hypothetical protein